MPVELTGKITPKGGTFIGMVDAEQVIGASGAGGYLPSSAISGIKEYQLKISNTPSDGYYLQYKDSTDELTWAEVVGGSDVAWSGAAGFYTVSSNYYGHSSNKLIHAPSSNLKTWFDTIYEPIGASGEKWSGASDFYGFSSNAKSIYHPSGFVISGQEYSQAYASAQIALYKIQHGITSWDNTEFINSGIKWNGTNWIAMPSGGSGGDGSSQWTNRTGGIYYENEVSIGHAGFDLGNYKFQVSGPTYLSGQVTFKGSTFSGLADPTFPSGAANKHYVDTISSNINSKIIETSNGYANIQSGDSISHGLSSTPSYASVSPSGMSINFGASCRIEGSNIIAYLTAPGYRNVFWTASL